MQELTANDSPAASFGIFDAHFHVVDPRFPLIANQGFVPAAFGAADYLAIAAPLGITGGAVVAGSFQGLDPAPLLAAIDTLGPGYVAVAQLGADVTGEQIAALDARGVRAVRFNLRRGGSAPVDDLERLAARAWEVARWHVELYVDSAHLDGGLAARVGRLPRVVIDHLGLSAAGLPTLLRLVERGALVKATGFGRVDFDVGPALAQIAAANPGALLFGTDLPSTRAPRPFHPNDLELVERTLGPELARKALRENALALYRPELGRAGERPGNV